MYKFCVFAGTAEGRALTEYLLDRGAAVTACVATDYGEALLSPRPGLTVNAGGLDEEAMVRLLRENAFDLAVDATHPYAAAVTEQIARACGSAGTELLRLLRAEGDGGADALCFPDAAACAAWLAEREGRILLTCGSRELADFAGIPDFARRVWARVLPMERSLALCGEAGLSPGHIIAMQGPFSKELNLALLRSLNIDYLVTKDGGAAGGFPEKADAAREAGAKLLVLGRPPQTEGLSLAETIRTLNRRFGFSPRPRVNLVGIGPGPRAQRTFEAAEAMERADCLIGAKRMLAAAPERPGQRRVEAIAPDAIRAAIDASADCGSFAVLLSGDPGFFSGARKLLPLLADCQVSVLPGLSSLSLLCARFGTSWEDAVFLSLHGRDRDPVPLLRRNRRVFVLVGGTDGMGQLCRRLCAAGLGALQMKVGEDLGYPEERCSAGTAAELAERSFSPLSVALIENPAPDAPVTPGLPDSAFLRGGAESPVPMTKSEVRAVCLSKLRPAADSLCWDVGAGTGSVSVELALLCPGGRVYAVERREDALALLAENRERFHTDNLTVLPGAAPEALATLPAPDRVFIGGAGGRLREILSLALERNPACRIVVTAVTLETAAELTACLRDFDWAETEAVTLNVARSRPAGAYHLLRSENPVTVFTLQGKGRTE